ncbi:MAG: hypothetical protein HYZ37_14855 [Candidatus Solibacter usitatus]|nr:hypothetical protein [Candidatus Solibacter usitatus]
MSARCIAGLFLLSAAYWAGRFAYADYLFQSGRHEDLVRAAELIPFHPVYEARLGNLKEAVRWNPYYSEAWREMAEQAERNGNLEDAERNFLQAAKVDRMFDSRWALANFYFRRNRREEFWHWMRLAAERSYGDRQALFLLAQRAADHPADVLHRVAAPFPDCLRRYLDFLLQEKQYDQLGEAVTSFLSHATREDRAQILEACHILTRNGEFASAREAWNLLSAKKWIPAAASNASNENLLMNAGLAWRPLDKGFDWIQPWRAGVQHVWMRPGRLRILLNGRQEENTSLLEQLVEAAPHSKYRLSFRYATRSIPTHSGVRWRVHQGETERFSAAQFLSSEEARTDQIEFQTGAAPPRITVRLVYERMPGTVRPAGEILLDGAFSLTRTR